MYLYAHTFYSCSSNDKSNVINKSKFSVCVTVFFLLPNVCNWNRLTSTKLCLPGVHCLVYGTCSESILLCFPLWRSQCCLLTSLPHHWKDCHIHQRIKLLFFILKSFCSALLSHRWSTETIIKINTINIQSVTRSKLHIWVKASYSVMQDPFLSCSLPPMRWRCTAWMWAQKLRLI